MVRKLEEAVKVYMTYRKKLLYFQKRKFSCFEGQRFFRFGNSWRRLSFNKKKVVVLNDNSEKMFIENKG